MKVILLENIKSLGNKGDIKNVSNGYAMNFLLLKNKAVLATLDNISKQKDKSEKVYNKVEKQKDNYEKIFKVLNNITISFIGKVSEKEHLFQAIHIKDVINYVKNNFNLDLNEKWFKGNISLKILGKFPISLKLPNKNTINMFIEIKSD